MKIALALLFLPLISILSFAQAPKKAGPPLQYGAPESVGVSDDKLLQVDVIMQRLIGEGKLPGGVVMINRRGRTIFLRAYGQKNLTTKEGMRPNTLFRIYSMTKAITSAAALKLVEEGKLKLDAPVSDYFPAFADQVVLGKTKNDGKPERPVLVRDLLRHTSGLGYPWALPPVEKEKLKDLNIFDRKQSMEDFVAKAACLPLLFEPGSDWLYGINTDLVGALVEKCSGHTLRSYFRKHFFIPLGMTDTDFHAVDAKRLAPLFNLKDGKLKTNHDKDKKYLDPPNFQSGGGGLVSTASDYMTFLQMIANGGELYGLRYLTPETVRLMTTNDVPAPAMPIAFGHEERHGIGYSLGFNVRVADGDWDKAAPVGEIGWGGMASTHYWLHPQKELIVVTLEQVIPYSFSTEWAVKEAIYKAIK